MNNLKNYFIVVLLSSGMISCASVGGAWDAGTQIVTGTVDAVVGGAATITTAVADDVVSVGTLAVDTAQAVVVAGADLGKGVVKTVSDEVDRQTDELQKEDKDAPKKELTTKELVLLLQSNMDDILEYCKKNPDECE